MATSEQANSKKNSVSETGHLKNVTHFEQLIACCTGYGIAYQPSQQVFLLPQLTQIYNDATEAITKVNARSNFFNQATGTRQTVYEPLKPLATRIYNALEASGAPATSLKDARTIINKLTGKRASTATPQPQTDGTPAPVQISVSQQSYDRLTDHLEKLINLASIESSYNPNESNLKIASLNAYVIQLKAANTAVIQAQRDLNNARMTRDNLLYTQPNNLVDVATGVKSYVKSVFGARSEAYRQISGLSFRKQLKK